MTPRLPQTLLAVTAAAPAGRNSRPWAPGSDQWPGQGRAGAGAVLTACQVQRQALGTGMLMTPLQQDAASSPRERHTPERQTRSGFRRCSLTAGSSELVPLPTDLVKPSPVPGQLSPPATVLGALTCALPLTRHSVSEGLHHKFSNAQALLEPAPTKRRHWSC